MTYKTKLVFGPIDSRNNRGPGMVYKNLIQGLRAIDYSYMTLDGKDRHKFDIDDNKEIISSVIQPIGPDLDYYDLLGPNCFVLPRERPDLMEKANALVVPSQWVKDKYLYFDPNLVKDKPIHIWASGIDTNYWTSRYNNNPQVNHCEGLAKSNFKILVYFKNRDHSEWSLIKTRLIRAGIRENNIYVVTYGSYSQQDLLQYGQTCHACVTVTNTESQGLAPLEILSMNLPMLVFDHNNWQYEADYGIQWQQATSMPYFHESCGEKMTLSQTTTVQQMVVIDHFFQGVLLGKYRPRNWIVENFSLEAKAREYVSMCESIIE